MRLAALVLVAGCAAPTRLQVIRSSLAGGGPHGEPSGTCAATLRVRVVDGGGSPISGAMVVSHEGEYMNAPSMVPSQFAYATAEVVTNARGEATVCKPEGLRQYEKDMFTHSTGAYIEAKFDNLAGRALPPYRGPIVVRALDPL